MTERRRPVIPEPFRLIEAGPVQMMNFTPPAGAVVDPPVPDYVLHLVLDTPPLLRVGFNRPARWLVMTPGVLLAAPPDTAGDFIADGPSHVLSITIPKAHAADVARDEGLRIEVRHEAVFRDPRIARRLVGLWHALKDDAPGHRLLADHVMRDVLYALAHRTEPRQRPRHGRERLATPTIHRLRDFVEGHLADDVDVTMLAGVADLSPAHFARAFAATLGMTPYRYVMTRRLARGRELLVRTRRSALDVALAVGFKTPSHFTARFRREFGLTPRDVRPDRRGRPSRADFASIDRPDPQS